MSIYFWGGGAGLWTTPYEFVAPENSDGEFIRYPGPPGPGDVVVLSNDPTLDGISIEGETIEIYHTVVTEDTIQDTSFDIGTTILVTPSGAWDTTVFGSLTTAATIDVGVAGTFSEAAFLLAQPSASTELPLIVNSGIINVVNGELLLSDAGPADAPIDGQFLNLGVISIQNDGPSVAYVNDDLVGGSNGFVNDGTILVNGEGASNDTLAEGFFEGTLSGNGTIVVTDGELAVQAVTSGQLIVFADPKGLLLLGTADLPSGLFAATIEGFRPGDTIALDVAATSIDPSQVGVVRILNGVDVVGSLDVTASPGNTKFALAQSTSGLGLLEMVTACYAAGTCIGTRRGEIAIEDLAIGDLVTTASGIDRPIRWIGRRSYDGRFIAGNRDVLPILIRAGALADGVPRRDLLVSPRHAMFLNDVLIPAELLVNGRTIFQVTGSTDVTYLHLELDGHDIILAEGAPSETFVDRDSRMLFHNAHEFHARYPDAPIVEDCAPRVEDGDILETVRGRLAGRAGLPADHIDDAAEPGSLAGRIDVADSGEISGWAFDATRPHTPVRLHILAGGRVVGNVIANRYRGDLRQAGFGDGRCAFAFRVADGLSSDAYRTVVVRRVADLAVLRAGGEGRPA